MTIGFPIFLLFLLFTFFTCFCKQVPTVSAISCFVCSSRSYEEKYCLDPFHPVNATYEQQCKMSKEGRIGQFPAHYCIKISGQNVKTKEQLVVRMCSITSMDNQCGVFRFDNETLRGCILTCNKDGCNSSISTKISNSQFNLMIFLLTFSILYTLVMLHKRHF